MSRPRKPVPLHYYVTPDSARQVPLWGEIVADLATAKSIQKRADRMRGVGHEIWAEYVDGVKEMISKKVPRVRGGRRASTPTGR